MTDFALPERIRPGDRHVGRRVLRTENRSLLIGEGGFVDDLPTGPGTLHAAFLRSPHPRAEILSIDDSEARRIPGVHAVVTGEDMARETDPMIAGFRNPVDYYGGFSELQQAFHENFALQCGYCTPGFLMSLKEYPGRNPAPGREEIRIALSGNLCRCTGCHEIVNASLDAARALREKDEAPPGKRQARAPA